MSGGESRAAAAPRPSQRALRRLSRLLSEDLQVRAAAPSAGDLAWIREGRRFAIELVAAACERYGARPCLATRTGGSHAPYEAITYAELWGRVIALATGLDVLGAACAGDFVGIAGSPGIDWIVADLACLYRGAVSVPLGETATEDDLRHIVAEAELACVIGRGTKLEALASVLRDQASVGAVVVDEDAEPSFVDLLDGRSSTGTDRPRVHSLREVEARGRAAPLVLPALPTDDARLFSVQYTSGSTGAPKGVILTEGRWARTLRDALEGRPVPSITVAYLPLSHMAGRITIYTTMMMGGIAHFTAQSDMSTLFDDIRAARPLSLTLVPRVSGMIHQHFQSELVRRGGTPAATLDDPVAQTIMSEMREGFLGGRLCFVSTGAAPTAPEIATFLERCFEVQITDAYGSTEMGSVTINGRVQPWVSYKLVDVPELGYTTKDTPHPRGELAVKSSRESPGYFKNAGANARLRDDDGYVLSGDIVEEHGPGHLVWVDRKDSVIRLAQGEFVNVSRLEELFVANSPFIDQMYLYGDSRRGYVLAVIVPSLDAVASELANRSMGEGDEAIAILLRAEMGRVAAKSSLASHEVPRELLVERVPFTRENGLLTEANKPRRPRLRTRYGSHLDAIYAEVEARQLRQFETDAGATLEERVRAAIALTLGVDAKMVEAQAESFVRLGGDSLGAVRLAALVAEHCGVSLPVAAFLDPGTSITELVRKVEARREVPGASGGFERVHGHGVEWAFARDLRVASLVPADLVDRALALDVAGAPRVLLLTGASGFLGRFVLLELLAACARGGPDVVCVVRARDDDAASARVRAGYASDAALLARFDAAAAGAPLRVCAGDLMQPQLGLGDALYRELCSRVDGIVHAGALVNHALSYRDLFDPNVAGTAEIVRLAITERRKPIHFISTTGIAGGLRRTVFETDRASALWSRRKAKSTPRDYAQGYATSKWACETLLEDLAHACGVPVTIARCGMILPHPHYVTLNDGDAFTRLLFGILRTGIAPVSFFDEGYRAERHYDGLPVDIVAGLVGKIAMRAPVASFRIHHVSNSNWADGISLDTFVDWARIAGRRLERLPYAAWHEELGVRLLALDVEDQRRSPLSVLHRWESPIKDGEGLVKLDTTQFREELRDFTGTGGIPSLTEAYVVHCLRAIGAAS